jgi:hypothetical protein
MMKKTVLTNEVVVELCEGISKKDQPYQFIQVTIAGYPLQALFLDRKDKLILQTYFEKNNK